MSLTYFEDVRKAINRLGGWLKKDYLFLTVSLIEFEVPWGLAARKCSTMLAHRAFYPAIGFFQTYSLCITFVVFHFLCLRQTVACNLATSASSLVLWIQFVSCITSYVLSFVSNLLGVHLHICHERLDTIRLCPISLLKRRIFFLNRQSPALGTWRGLWRQG